MNTQARHLFWPALTCAALLATTPATADDGMWTFDQLPLERLATDHQFAPPPGWADHLRNSTVRLALGCSGSFISGHGLVLSNHHCARACLQGLSTPSRALVDSGYLAASPVEERKCPDLEVDQLVEITVVTDQIKSATAGRAGPDLRAAERAAIEAIENGCNTGEAVRCDVVTLFHGGIYDLYKYRRYQDVRLVFAPEGDAATFGDATSADWPLHALDMSLLRVYDHGKPLDTRANHLAFAAQPAKTDDLVFVVGNPGQTERLSTVAQLFFERDLRQPMIMADYAELYGMSAEAARESPELAQRANNEIFQSELMVGRFTLEHRALSNRGLIAAKSQAEADLRARVAADPALQAKYGGAWDAITAAMIKERGIYERFTVLETRPEQATLMNYACLLVRNASERAKPDGERLAGFGDSDQPALRALILSPAPLSVPWETRMMTWALARLPLYLGTSDSATIELLGHESPHDLATRLVGGTHLGDVKVRQALLDGGPAAIAASNDPLIVYIRDKWAPLAMAVREAYEEVQATVRANAALIDQARLAALGPRADPDATFTPRVSYGVVRGYAHGALRAPAETTNGEAFALGTWLAAKASLDMTTTLDLVSTADIVGGSSGSPMVDRAGDLVGLIFADNDAGEAGAFGHDDADMRAVAVSMPAIRTALTRIYHADRIMKEIDAK
jgi:hypothetical protein